MTFDATMQKAPPIGSVGIYMAIALTGFVFSWLSEYHVSHLPFVGPWDFSWLWYLAAALAVFWYLRGLGRTASGERPAKWRRVVYFTGLGAIYFVLQTHFDYLAQHMFFLNRVQHIVMHHLGPFLIALAWPGAMLIAGMPAGLARLTRAPVLRRGVAVLQQPALAAFLFVGLIVLWLVPSVHFRAMIDPRLYAIMNWSMVIDGVLFWCLVLDPRPSPPAFCSFPARIVTVVLIMFPQIATGALIAFAGRDVYAFYAWCGRIYPSIGALDDQQYGGLIIWIPAAMMSVVALLLVINMLRLADERTEHEGKSNDAIDHDGLVVSSKAWTGDAPGRNR